MLAYLILLVVLGLVTYRATRLVVDDEFPPVRLPREAILRWSEKSPGGGGVRRSIGDLLSCRYCASGWVSLTVTCAAWVWLPAGVPMPPFTWFATWAIGVLIYNREEPVTQPEGALLSTEEKIFNP